MQANYARPDEPPSPPKQNLQAGTENDPAEDRADEGQGPEELRARDAEIRQQYLERLDFEFERQPRDRQWTITLEDSLEEAINDSDVQEAEVVRAECSSSFCRSELSFASRPDYQQFDVWWHQMNPLGDGQSVGSRRTEGGRIVVSLYRSHSGHQLPRNEEIQLGW